MLPPKSRAGRRIVGIPEVIVPALRKHLAVFAEDDPGALVFPGAKGGPLRRGNFNKMSAWSPLANGPLMARTVSDNPRLVRPGLTESPLTWAFRVERVTGIEPALSAWESDRLWPITSVIRQLGRPGVAVIDRSSPWLIAR